MSREDVQTNLRLPADLKDRLTEAANRNKRSLSAEAAFRLHRSFTDAGTVEAEEANRRLEMFMPFFAGLLASASKLVEQVPIEKRTEPGPALMIQLIAGLFDGAVDGKRALQIVDAIGPVIGIEREKTGSDIDRAAAIDSIRASVAEGHDVGRKLDLIEEAQKRPSGEQPQAGGGSDAD